MLVLAVTEAMVLPSIIFSRTAEVAASGCSSAASRFKSDWMASDFNDSATPWISRPVRSIMDWTGLPFSKRISAPRSGISRLSVSSRARSCSEVMECMVVESETKSSRGCTSSKRRSTCIGLCASMVSPCVAKFNEVAVSVIKSRLSVSMSKSSPAT